ncbi:hypothetical protein D9757_013347 [Collybiopsis confluens]|uniref:Halogenase n=1 Tax=Collybiopsis confluens TaxID=2823264 RepID=A0A8H5D9Z3_9AGAR|nr:hypothetical protein D9757_013347 [Collybiopsis confluens]
MSLPTAVPTSASILVIGGGPAGSYAAAALQREGHQVVLLESSKFPRYHIGESMLPSFRNYLRFIDVEDKVVQHGFKPKPGATFKLDHSKDTTWTDFTAHGPTFGTFNVIRSELDDIMLRHAESQGAQVYEETRVESIEFEGDPTSSRPIAANWVNKQGASGKISFEWLVDASGRAGIMSTKYLKNRQMRESLRNVAVWGYWTGARLHGEGTKIEGSGYFEALTDESGWAWAIVLHDGTTSVGVVMHQDVSNKKKSALSASGEKMSLTEHYLDQLQYAPGISGLLRDTAKMVPGSIKIASDYSYYSPECAGDHFRVIGDAANFVDPFFSSGVHIAMTGGLSAAVSICASIRNQVSEKVAQDWHNMKVGIAHTRFLFVVLGAYQQMHLQTSPVLTSDVNATNFDEAFAMFRPVIYGTADSSRELTNEQVRDMVDKLQDHFEPVNPEQVASVRQRYGAEFLRMDANVLGASAIADMTEGDQLGKKVLTKFDTLRVFQDDIDVKKMGRQALVGYSANIELGNLGLVEK